MHLERRGRVEEDVEPLRAVRRRSRVVERADLSNNGVGKRSEKEEFADGRECLRDSEALQHLLPR